MEKTKKINYYSIAIISFIYLIMVSIPFSRFIKNEWVSYSLEMAMRIGFIPIYFLYSKKNNLTFPKWKSAFPPFLIIPLLLICFSNLITGSILSYERVAFDNTSVLKDLFRYLFVGINEELLFRGILLEEIKENSSKAKTILISSFCFGLIHLVNISSLGSIPTVLAQCGYSFVTGLLFSTVYLYSGSIIYPIIFHFLFDFLNSSIAVNIYSLEWDIYYFLVNIGVGALVLAYNIIVYSKIKEVSHVSEAMDN